MAVVPMQKVRVLTHQSDVDTVLSVMQRFGAAEFHELSLADTEKLVADFKHADLLPRVEHAVAYLKSFAPRVSLFKGLREGTQVELTEDDIKARLRDTDAVAQIVDDVDALQVEYAELTERVKELELERATLEQWKDLPFRLADLETKRTKTYLLTAGAASTPLSERITNALEAAEVACSVTALDSETVAVTVIKDEADRKSVTQLFEEEGVTLVPLPTGEEEPSIELVRVEQELAEAKGKLALTYDQAEHMAISHLRSLQVAAELFTWERAAHETKDLAAATKHAVVFEGWINQNKRSAIDAALVEQETAVIIENIELAEGEEPPVEIENNRFIRPFEAVTRLYGMPGYTDLDPTLFLAGFFFLFFGLSLTDVGYGLTLVVLSGGLLLFAKLKKPARAMLQLLFYIGIATVLVGMLFGGYFGIAPELIPEPLRAIQQFDPIGNPLPVFYLALGLGVFQVMVGLTLKIYSDYRNGRLASGLWEQGPWLLLFSIGIVYVLTVIEYLTVPSQTLLGLTYLGLLLLVIGAILRSTGLLNAITNIGGSLYGSVGFLSDVLSYSRLLALGLATTALAFAVNLIAGIVFNTHPIIGPVFAVFILIIGHVFTLAVNTLGAFIHSARLQFVEFFGKFVAGTGRSFNPLARSEDHITITEP